MGLLNLNHTVNRGRMLFNAPVHRPRGSEAGARWRTFLTARKRASSTRRKHRCGDASGGQGRGHTAELHTAQWMPRVDRETWARLGQRSHSPVFAPGFLGYPRFLGLIYLLLIGIG